MFFRGTGRNPAALPLEALGVLAARALERAILRAVLHACPAAGLPSARELLEPDAWLAARRRAGIE